MAQYTSIDDDYLEGLLSYYDIGLIRSYALLRGGSENTNYLINTSTGKYVLSICEQKSMPQTQELANLLIHLQQNDFRTSIVVFSKGKEPVMLWKGKPIMIKKYLEGQIIKDFCDELLYRIGSELATLHKVEAPSYLPNVLNFGIEVFNKVSDYAADSEFERWLQKIEDYISPYLELDLPKAFIHSDVFWNNVIVSDDLSTATVMDFEEAVYYYKVFDIGMTIIGTCADKDSINIEKGKQLLSGYQSSMELSVDELSSLRAFTIYAGASMTFWRHQNFNNIKPDPTMFNHYMGLQVLVDYMLDQDDDCFTSR